MDRVNRVFREKVGNAPVVDEAHLAFNASAISALFRPNCSCPVMRVQAFRPALIFVTTEIVLSSPFLHATRHATSHEQEKQSGGDQSPNTIHQANKDARREESGRNDVAHT